jgi:hypothetical protein
MFVGGLLDLNFRRSHRSFVGQYSDIAVNTNTNPRARYSVITLNYDMVLENICEFVTNNYRPQEWRVSFIDSVSTEDSVHSYNGKYAPSLAKLHGSVETGNIIPPTWNKGNHPEIVPTWKLAYQLLTGADHLRIIGYSLPTADSYVRYLFKSAVISNQHLKTIDIVCLDPDGSVKARYDQFVKFDYYRFFNADTLNYLTLVGRHASSAPTLIELNRVEEAHSEFTSRN